MEWCPRCVPDEGELGVESSSDLLASGSFSLIDALNWLRWTLFELPTGFHRSWALPAGMLLCFPGLLVRVSDLVVPARHAVSNSPGEQGMRRATTGALRIRLVIAGAVIGLGIWIAILGLNDNRSEAVLNAVRPWFSLPVFALIAGGVGLAGIGAAIIAAPSWLGRFRDLPDWRAILFRTGTRVTGLYLILIFFLGFVPF